MSFSLSIEGKGVHPHLLDHSQEAVAAGGRQVFPQADLLDEVEVGIEDFLWGMVAEHADEQTDNAFHDEGVALCPEVNHFFTFHFHKVRHQPDHHNNDDRGTHHDYHNHNNDNDNRRNHHDYHYHNNDNRRNHHHDHYHNNDDRRNHHNYHNYHNYYDHNRRNHNNSRHDYNNDHHHRTSPAIPVGIRQLGIHEYKAESREN